MLKFRLLFFLLCISHVPALRAACSKGAEASSSRDPLETWDAQLSEEESKVLLYAWAPFIGFRDQLDQAGRSSFRLIDFLVDRYAKARGPERARIIAADGTWLASQIPDVTAFQLRSAAPRRPFAARVPTASERIVGERRLETRRYRLKLDAEARKRFGELIWQGEEYLRAFSESLAIIKQSGDRPGGKYTTNAHLMWDARQRPFQDRMKAATDKMEELARTLPKPLPGRAEVRAWSHAESATKSERVYKNVFAGSTYSFYVVSKLPALSADLDAVHKDWANMDPHPQTPLTSGYTDAHYIDEDTLEALAQ